MKETSNGFSLAWTSILYCGLISWTDKDNSKKSVWWKTLKNSINQHNGRWQASCAKLCWHERSRKSHLTFTRIFSSLELRLKVLKRNELVWLVGYTFSTVMRFHSLYLPLPLLFTCCLIFNSFFVLQSHQCFLTDEISLCLRAQLSCEVVGVSSKFTTHRIAQYIWCHWMFKRRGKVSSANILRMIQTFNRRFENFVIVLSHRLCWFIRPFVIPNYN